MGSVRSGSGQTLSVGGTAIAGVGTGFTGLTLTPAAGTFTVDSGGIQTVQNAGPVVATGTFGVGETTNANTALLGQNGTRKQLIWVHDGITETFNAVLQVSRTFDDQGPRRYEVSLTVDGNITIT